MRLKNHTGLVLAASLLAGAASANPVLADYVTGFEQPEYVPGGLIYGQDGWSAGVSARIQTEAQLQTELSAAGLNPVNPVHGGNQALIATGGSTNIRPVAGLADHNKVALDFWSRPLTPGTSGSTVGANLGNSFITMEDQEGHRAAAVRFGGIVEGGVVTQTSIDVYTSAHPNGGAGWLSTNISWAADTWYHIRFEADYLTKTFDFYLNDVKLNSIPVAFYATNSDNLSQIRVFVGSNQAGMILDDLSVTGLPEPATAGLLLASGAAILVRRKARA